MEQDGPTAKSTQERGFSSATVTIWEYESTRRPISSNARFG